MFISRWTLKLKNQNSGHFQHHQRVKICVSRGQERRLLAIRWFPVLEGPSARYWTRVACNEQATWIGDYSCQSVLLQWVCRLRFLTIRICIGCFILKVLDFWPHPSALWLLENQLLVACFLQKYTSLWDASVTCCIAWGGNTIIVNVKARRPRSSARWSQASTESPALRLATLIT